jgi:hypothetical protein
LERKMSFFAFRSGKSHRGLRLANRQPRGVSEGILEGPVPMMRPCPRKNIASIPEIFLSWTRQRNGGISRELLHWEDHPCLRNRVPELSDLQPSTRIFPTKRGREPWLMTWGRSPREDRVNQLVVGELQEVHWPWGGSLWEWWWQH